MSNVNKFVNIKEENKQNKHYKKNCNIRLVRIVQNHVIVMIMNLDFTSLKENGMIIFINSKLDTPFSNASHPDFFTS